MKTRATDWRKCATSLAKAIPRTRLHPTVLAWADASAPTAKWAVAFSGGADSLALLLLVWAHWPERRRRLVALHFNHRLRGRESGGDAAFCARVCRALGVTLMSARAPTAGADLSEAEARAMRMAFFARHARAMWFGHQQDDIAETMLMRLARGSGLGGLAAPRPVQAMPKGRVHVRPLLTLKKAEIAAALSAAGAVWREDSTNGGADFFRNRIRRDVLPRWAEAAQRDALAGAARSRELLEEDDTALEAWTDALGALQADGTLAIRKLASKPRAVVRRALHRWLAVQPQAGELSRQGFEALLVAVERGAPTRQSLGREGFAVVRKGRLRFEPVGNRRVKLQRRAN